MAALTKEFGADTGAGVAPADIGAAGLTISSGDASGHWQVSDSGGRTLLSISATGAGNLSSTYDLTLSNADTVAILCPANATTFDSSAALETAGESGSLAFGDQLLIREGTYAAKFDIRRSALPTGTAVDPSVSEVTTGGITRLQGMNFAGCNYVKIRPCLGETVTFTESCSIRQHGGFWVQGITFNIERFTPLASPSSAGMLFIRESAEKIIIQGNTFEGRNLEPAVDSDVDFFEPAVNCKDTGANSGDGSHVYIADNTALYVRQMLVASIGLAGPLVIFGNDVRKVLGDNYAIGQTPSGFIFAWNKSRDVWKTSPSGHVDFLQATKTTAETNYTLVGNRLTSGLTDPRGYNQPQGLFSEGTGGSVDGVKIFGNMLVVDVANTIGIKQNNTTNVDARFNTVVSNVNAASTYLIQVTGTKNVGHDLTGDNTDIDETSLSSYTANFKNPRWGSAMAENIEDDFGNKVGGPADLAGDGPDGANFRYDARVYSLTGVDTSGEPVYSNGIGGGGGNVNQGRAAIRGGRVMVINGLVMTA